MIVSLFVLKNGMLLEPGAPSTSLYTGETFGISEWQ